jgi:hypothetical protein
MITLKSCYLIQDIAKMTQEIQGIKTNVREDSARQSEKWDRFNQVLESMGHTLYNLPRLGTISNNSTNSIQNPAA